MKHSFLEVLISKILAVLMVLFNYSACQAIDINLGYKAGISKSGQSYKYSISNFDFERLDRVGFSTGAFVGFSFTKSFGLRTELQYVEKGSGVEAFVTTESSPTGIRSQTFEDHADYLSINLLAVFSPFEPAGFNPYLIAGPRLDVLLTSSSEVDSPVLYDLNSTGFGATIGVGTALEVNNSISLLFETLYAPDISKFYEGEFLTVKNSSLLFMTGISF